MDYPLENLGPEKFQLFCQSLLSRNYPELQCFPVGQPDGGRDAIAYFAASSRKDFMLFQVKYVRRPLATRDPHIWLKEILEEELPKIKKQIPAGAKRFVLITNAPGTAHPAVGSIDKVAELLSTLDIPAQCWWRDDINRRLDDAWDIKWSYPEIFSGPDLLRLIIESDISSNSERRVAAIRAFLADQFGSDSLVRFKQVDLENNLLDLFIDVPIALPSSGITRKQEFIFSLMQRRENLHSINDHETILSDQEIIAAPEEDRFLGAATFLLSSISQKVTPFIVLEGAPGQGKSTITQYVCQVHRMRLLDVEPSGDIPSSHKEGPLRLPIRVDLRDFATWISGENPFTPGAATSFWRKSLESFLAAQILHHSGGINFEVADLLALARTSAILIVLDGLDEVADISKRQEVVNEIVAGVERLKANTASLQIVVTSRPAAFANSPGLPERRFPYFKLESLSLQLINEYADKWLRARRVKNKEASELKRTLKSRLDQPHLRDLARNPMQLTILLSLVHTRGASLPDKRTALYDSYVDLFFSRESEKSIIVRDHRDLLINIHRFLAWELHTAAELGSNSGSIRTSDLQDLLRTYLSTEGHNPDLAHTLFAGLVERVVAIVSRVQGTYEFEVQPLREYFAARYLYDTAPYSPAGRERRGTLPDRFNAIARNFYWLNVTRFYAGCYSKGELPSLIYSLQDLKDEEGFRYINHPRMLAIMLLADWVFTQHPKSVKQVIGTVLADTGFHRLVVSQSRRFGSRSPLALPKNCGREEIEDHCFSLLAEQPPRDYVMDLADFLGATTERQSVLGKWRAHVNDRSPDKQTYWLESGLLIKQISRLPKDELEAAIGSFPRTDRTAQALLRANRFDLLESEYKFFKLAVQEILSSTVDLHLSSHRYLLAAFASSLAPWRYCAPPWYPGDAPLNANWRQRGPFSALNPDPPLSTETKNKVAAKCREFVRTSARLGDYEIRRWKTEIAPWNELVECGRRLFGDQWAFLLLANAAASIRSKQESCTESSTLFDQNDSLCSRIRYARLRAGSPGWWKEQLNEIDSPESATLALLVLLTWGGNSPLVKLSNEINVIVESLPQPAWNRLLVLVRISLNLPLYNGSGLELPPKNAGARLLSIWCRRTDLAKRVRVFRDRLLDYDGNDPTVLSFCQSTALEALDLKAVEWTDVLEIFSRSYLLGVASGEPRRNNIVSRLKSDLPLEIAKKICSDPDVYPSFLISWAEEAFGKHVTERIVPVGITAKNDRWFEPE